MNDKEADKEIIIEEFKYCLNNLVGKCVSFDLSYNKEASCGHNVKIFDVKMKFQFMNDELSVISHIRCFVEHDESCNEMTDGFYIRFSLQNDIAPMGNWNVLDKQNLYLHMFHDCLYRLWRIEY